MGNMDGFRVGHFGFERRYRSLLFGGVFKLHLPLVLTVGVKRVESGDSQGDNAQKRK